jgi:hypothetical protein
MMALASAREVPEAVVFGSGERPFVLEPFFGEHRCLLEDAADALAHDQVAVSVREQVGRPVRAGGRRPWSDGGAR